MDQVFIIYPIRAFQVPMVCAAVVKKKLSLASAIVVKSKGVMLKGNDCGKDALTPDIHQTRCS